MPTSIIFFNAFHNGDIHVSRSFVKYITEHMDNINFYYAHENKQILNDIPKIKEDKSLMGQIGDNYKLESFERGDLLYLNTWYASGNHKYMNQYGITYDCLYFLMESHFNKLGLTIPGPVELYPSIDYSYYKIDGIKEYMDKFWRKIFISNGQSLSGQADNFSMSHAINKLSSENPDKHFFITNEDSAIQHRDNIHFTRQIINKDGCDLNENAYISSFCDMVIGRASGAFSFTLNKDSLFNKDILYISISNMSFAGDYWIGERFKDNIKYKSKVINYDISNVVEFESVISKHMEEINWRVI